MRVPILSCLAFALAALAPVSAVAAVKDTGPDHMTLTFTATVKAEPVVAYRALSQVGQWWNGAHSWSGDAKNMTLELSAGGCFCERWSGGSVEHARVLLAQAGQTLRLDAPLGPIQELGAKATLTYRFTAGPSGGTIVDVTYVVIGVPSQGLDTLAPVVDGVIGESVTRLAAFVDATPK
jgi:hypothetical protein